MARLIAQMVAKDEESRFLRPVLERLYTFADLIVFTDDCSEDGTAEVAEEYCKVFRMETPTFRVNESKLRSTAWSHLAKYAQPGDWILAIDADEELYGIEHLPRLLDQSQYDVLGINFYHMWNSSHYRIDKLWVPNVGSRLFRFRLGGEFTGRRMACGSEPTYVNELLRTGKMLWQTPLMMKHRGYERDVDKIAKYQRYMFLDGGDFHARSHLESIMDPNPTLLPWTLDG